jgi:hypothetical protein
MFQSPARAGLFFMLADDLGARARREGLSQKMPRRSARKKAPAVVTAGAKSDSKVF